MTDIPEDVMKVARKIVREFSAVSMYEDEHEEAIALAILADRATQAERMARLEEATVEKIEFEPPTQEWIPVHRRTLALLGNHKALRAGLGKMSPAKCAELGMDKASSDAIEALYALLEADDYFIARALSQEES